MPEPTKWRIPTVSVPEATPRKPERRSVAQRKQMVNNKLGAAGLLTGVQELGHLAA
jgi:hypothetical protein